MRSMSKYIPTFCIKCGKELKSEHFSLLKELNIDDLKIKEFELRFCPMVRCELYKVYQKGLEEIEVSLKKDNWTL